MLSILLALLPIQGSLDGPLAGDFQVRQVQTAIPAKRPSDVWTGVSPASRAWLDEHYPLDRLALMAATSDGRKAFIPDPGTGLVAAVDLWNQEELGATEVGVGVGMGVVLPGDIDYVVCVAAENRVVFLNTASHAISADLKIQAMTPKWSAVDPGGRFLFVAGDLPALQVITLPQRRLSVQVPLPIVPRHSVLAPDGQALLFVGEAGAIRLEAPATAPDSSRPDTDPAESVVYVMGMTHSGHRTSKQWGLDHVAETIRRIKPDVVVTEIPPDRYEAALAGWRRDGRVSEPRVMRFPEYTDVLFQLMDEMGFGVEPAAAWTSEMNNLRNARIAQFNEDPEHADAFGKYTARNAEIERAQAENPVDEDNPLVIHSEVYDLRTEQALEPYDTFLNEWIGPGGWTNINLGHARLAEQAILRHPGKRILITFGAGHKYWMSRYLAQRGFTIGDIRPFLPQSAELPMSIQVEREIKDLHRFFEDWYLGRVANTDGAYARFAMALADGFVIVVPDGRTVPKAELLEGLRGAYASREGAEHAFAIHIRNIVTRDLGHGQWLVRYEEWQDADGESEGRVSSAVLVEEESAPAGFSWVQVQETWL